MTLEKLAERFSAPELNRGRLSLIEYLALDKKDPNQKKMRDAEKNGEAFIPAEFHQPNVRNDDGVVRINGFVLDFDKDVAKAEIELKLNDHAYIAYTTYSHHTGEDHWRVLIPYGTSCLPEQHPAVYEHFKTMFNGRLDSRSATKSQLWYTPACPHDAANGYEMLLHKGKLFNPYSVESPSSSTNLKMLVDRQAKAVERPSAVTGAATIGTDHHVTSLIDEQRDNLVSALAFIPADDRAVWIRVGMALKQEYGEAALNIWLDWSRKSDKFDDDDAQYNWDSFKEHKSGVTLGTIFWLAKEGGWTPEDNAATLIAVAELNESHFISREGGEDHRVPGSMRFGYTGG